MRRNVLITGASSGIGRGLAREFAGLGRNLALCARRSTQLDLLREELTSAHPNIRVITRKLDVNDHGAVFDVFRAFRDELGTIDRVIVNAGLGKGASLGTGYFYANVQTAQTNFVAALAQCEAALEIFRAQNGGHLVTISSISALRGMRRSLTTYAATKAGLAALTEGIRADLLGTPIRVSTMFPGYIRSEMTERVKNTRFMIDTQTGSRLLARAIEAEKEHAYVPAWPWAPLAFFMKRLPLRVVARMF